MSWPSIATRPPVHIVEAEQDPADGRLAGAARPDDGDGLAGRHREADVLEDRPARVVAEVDILEEHAAALGPERHGALGGRRTSGGAPSKLNITSRSTSDCLISR